MPILHGRAEGAHRDRVICEYDYAATPIAERLGVGAREAVIFMVADRRYKLIHCEGGFRPILFDLEADPDELQDLGDSEQHAAMIEEMYERLFAWTRRISQRTTRSEAQLQEMRTAIRRRGVVLGAYDENDMPLELTVHYRNRKAAIRKPAG
ncbi:hypothetical protein [Neoaquamicrobium sediminum]|uniref:hypothetical protein n=1 Tax=Neoaquamicrobium sediminum TaxID=1849104 RepID=UPI0028AADF05|nr:hypothetical protein [Mesorhizobium sediminum]